MKHPDNTQRLSLSVPRDHKVTQDYFVLPPMPGGFASRDTTPATLSLLGVWLRGPAHATTHPMLTGNTGQHENQIALALWTLFVSPLSILLRHQEGICRKLPDIVAHTPETDLRSFYTLGFSLRS
jgi:hypothetical protein